MPMCDACQCMHNGRNRHVSVHCELSTALVSGAANARRRFSRFSRLLFDMYPGWASRHDFAASRFRLF
jgi:hypothetical protein